MDERIEALTKKKAQIENRIKQLQAREKDKERKERTRRLIQIGAIIETRLGIRSVEEATEFCDKHLSIKPKDV